MFSIMSKAFMFYMLVCAHVKFHRKKSLKSKGDPRGNGSNSINKHIYLFWRTLRR